MKTILFLSFLQFSCNNDNTPSMKKCKICWLLVKNLTSTYHRTFTLQNIVITQDSNLFCRHRHDNQMWKKSIVPKTLCDIKSLSIRNDKSLQCTQQVVWCDIWLNEHNNTVISWTSLFFSRVSTLVCYITIFLLSLPLFLFYPSLYLICRTCFLSP